MTATLVANCPRCGAQHQTFDVYGNKHVGKEYGWRVISEAFCVCRACRKGTVFLTAQGDIAFENLDMFKRDNDFAKDDSNLNAYVNVIRYISLRDIRTIDPPEYIPDDVLAAFQEGATCLSVQCWNAAGAMFRTCVDLASKELLPKEGGEGNKPNHAVRTRLADRLAWLIEETIIPSDLKELSACIKDNGNDGAHDATLKQEDAEDLLDFTTALLERLYTEPRKIELMQERRVARRKQS